MKQSSYVIVVGGLFTCFFCVELSNSTLTQKHPRFFKAARRSNATEFARCSEHQPSHSSLPSQPCTQQDDGVNALRNQQVQEKWPEQSFRAPVSSSEKEEFNRSAHDQLSAFFDFILAAMRRCRSNRRATLADLRSLSIQLAHFGQDIDGASRTLTQEIKFQVLNRLKQRIDTFVTALEEGEQVLWQNFGGSFMQFRDDLLKIAPNNTSFFLHLK